MADMRDPLRTQDPARGPGDPYATRPSRMNWGWIVGGVAVVVIVLILLFGIGSSEQSATNNPAANTGQSTATSPPPAAPGRAPPAEGNTGAR